MFSVFLKIFSTASEVTDVPSSGKFFLPLINEKLEVLKLNKQKYAEELATILGTSVSVIKSADQSRTNITTPANDSELSFTMTANKTYEIDFVLYLASVDTDLQFCFVSPALSGGTHYFNVRTHDVEINPAPVPDYIFFSTNPCTIYGKTIVRCGASGGTFALQWCNGAATGNPLTVKKGSYIKYLES